MEQRLGHRQTGNRCRLASGGISVVLAGLGIAVGSGLVLGASRIVEGLVFGVSPWSPVSLIVVAVLAGRWKEVDAGWNRNLCVERPSFSRDLPSGDLGASRILHYCGNLKPWMYSSGSHHHALYYRYLDLTAWKGWRPKHDWRSAALARYESSPLRRILDPLEQWYLRLNRRITARYTSMKETSDLE
jgi:hypothetical protein